MMTVRGRRWRERECTLCQRDDVTIVRVIVFVLVPPSGSGRRRSQDAGSGAPGARRRSCVQEMRRRRKRSLGTRSVTTMLGMTGRPRAATDDTRWAERFCFVLASQYFVVRLSLVVVRLAVLLFSLLSLCLSVRVAGVVLARASFVCVCVLVAVGVVCCVWWLLV